MNTRDNYRNNVTMFLGKKSDAYLITALIVVVTPLKPLLPRLMCQNDAHFLESYFELIMLG